MANNSSTRSFWGQVSEPLSWTPMPISYLIIMILSTLFNGLVLYVFARHAHLRTAFNVYIVNLLFTNLLETFIQMPLNIATYLRSHWWLGSAACTVFIYGLSLQAVAICSHLLITVNRLWAVTSPITYRNHHTKTVSTGLCISIWLYVHTVHTPGYVIDAVYYRPPIEYGCFVNGMKQYDWFHAMQFTLFKIPVLIIVCCYPYIAYKSFKSRTFRSLNSTAPATVADSSRIPSGSTTRHVPDVIEQVLRTRREEGARRRGAFVLLSLMTFSMLVFWTPSAVYYTVLSFGRVNWPIVEQVVNIMCLLETIADPICFTLALQEVRGAVKEVLRQCIRLIRKV